MLNSAKVFDGGTIDQNLCDRVNFTDYEYKYNSVAGIKKYVLKKDADGNKLPYLVRRDGTLVRVFAIHCSGRAKTAIKAFDRSYAAVCMSQMKAQIKIKLGALKGRLLSRG